MKFSAQCIHQVQSSPWEKCEKAFTIAKSKHLEQNIAIWQHFENVQILNVIFSAGVWFDKSKKNPEKWVAGLGSLFSLENKAP